MSVATAFHQTGKLVATSKNCFLVFWVRDFVLTKVLEIPEYWMYCGIFNANCEGKRSGQNPKGEFLEVPWCLLYVFQVFCHCETRPKAGRGNPPDEWNQVSITTKTQSVSVFPGTIRYISVLTGGLPRRCAPCNDSIYLVR